MAEVYTAPAGSGSDVILLNNPYKVDWIRATGAGIGGALALMGWHFFLWWGYQSEAFNMPLLFGSFLTSDYIMANVLGMVAMIGLYVSAAWAYAYLLWVFRMQSNGGKGTIYGFLVFVPLYAFVLPWVFGLSARWGLPHANSSFIPNIDVMLNQAGQGNLGWEAVSLVAGEHLLYGLMIGAVYRHVVQPLGGRYRLRYLGD